MVAIQKVEYARKGDIAQPRKEFMKLRRDLNGDFTSNSGHWHRHTIAADNQKSFDRALEALKKDLARVNAEVLKIDSSGPTVVDVFYLIENRSRTAEVLKSIRRGNYPPELALGDLTPGR